MNLTPWKSSNAVGHPKSRGGNGMEQFQREMNNLMNNFFTKWDVDIPSAFEFGSYPSVDIQEKDNKYLLDADVPGMDEKDIDIDFRNNTLVLKGEKKSESKTKEEGVICVERSYGSFRREIPFDDEVDQDNIKASLKNGVLHLEMPKKAKDKTGHKKIQILH